MKYFIILSLCFLYSCSGKLENNKFIVTKKVEYKKDLCSYHTDTYITKISGVDIYNIIFYDSCNCYQLGDTLKIGKFK